MVNLILLRHGESLWNRRGLFTGWVDVPLSAKGVEEARRAGEILAAYRLDGVYVSSLVRSMMTAMIALSQSAQILESEGKYAPTPIVVHPDFQGHWGNYQEGRSDQNRRDPSPCGGEATLAQEASPTRIDVHVAWQLNERYYGDLQGLCKKKTAERYGHEQVHRWRRSYRAPPPQGESLEMTAQRTLPFFNQTIRPMLNAGKTILVSAHGNSLRSIIMELEQLSEEEVTQLEIATGDPLIYHYREGIFTKKSG